MVDEESHWRLPPDKQSKGIIQSQIAAGVRKPNYNSIAYFDLDKQAWRAFHPAMFIQECCVSRLCPATDDNEEAFEDWQQMAETEK